MQAPNKPQSDNEVERVTSDILPGVIKAIAGIAVLIGVVLALHAFNTKDYWELVPASSTLLTAPFLYAVADIVQSLRTITWKTLDTGSRKTDS